MSTQRGAVAESMFCTWALSQGYDVCFPARGTAPPYDVVMVNGTAFARVQVKRAHRRMRGNNQNLRVCLCDRNSKPYRYDAADMFAIVDVDTGRIWMIPFGTHNGRSLGLTGNVHDHWLVCNGTSDNPKRLRRPF